VALGLLALCAMAILAGCRGGRGAVAGTWHPIQKNSTVESPQVIQGNDLVLNPDGTYTLHGFPAMEGTWKLEGRKLTLTHKKPGGQAALELTALSSVPDPSAPLILELAEDR